MRANPRRGYTVVSRQKILDAFTAHYLGGRNTVADLGRRISYTTRRLSQGDFPAEDDIGVIRTLVDRLGHELEPSILIGGWATFIASVAK